MRWFWPGDRMTSSLTAKFNVGVPSGPACQFGKSVAGSYPAVSPFHSNVLPEQVAGPIILSPALPDSSRGENKRAVHQFVANELPHINPVGHLILCIVYHTTTILKKISRV